MDAEYRQTTRKGHEMRREDEDEEKNQKESTAGKKNSYSFSLQNDKSTTREKIRTISRLNLKHRKFINDTSQKNITHPCKSEDVRRAATRQLQGGLDERQAGAQPCSHRHDSAGESGFAEPPRNRPRRPRIESRSGRAI